MELPQSKSEYTVSLAKELIDDIELVRLSGRALIMKARRLARLAGPPEVYQWLGLELSGYSGDALSLKYMGATRRWTDWEKKLGHWGPFPQHEAQLEASRVELNSLRVPDVSISEGGARRPFDFAPAPGVSAQTIVASVYARANALNDLIGQLSAITSSVLGLLHTYACEIHHERVFSGLAETIFEQYRSEVDALLAPTADIGSKIESVYQRLAEGDAEAISQALNTCRRIIDSFADAVYPPREGTLDIGGQSLQLGPENQRNRINAHIAERVASEGRKRRLRQTLANLYDRVSAGVHKDVTPEEARSLFLEAYLFLGELLTLPPLARHPGTLPAVRDSSSTL